MLKFVLLIIKWVKKWKVFNFWENFNIKKFLKIIFQGASTRYEHKQKIKVVQSKKLELGVVQFTNKS